MAGGEWHADNALIRSLHEEPWRFDFFHAVRLLAAAHRSHPRVGYSTSLAQDFVRFGEEASTAFAPSSLATFGPPATGGPPKLTVHFFGLLGPNGPMPLRFTEYVLDRLAARDTTLLSFLDVFHNRMLAFFFRAWADSNQAVSHDRPEEDPFERYFRSVIGLGMPSLRGRNSVADAAKVHFSGHLVCRTRHAEGLVAILEGYFGVPVELSEYEGEWLRIPEESLCRLGVAPENAVLGESAVAGSSVWSVQHLFRLRIGPLPLADYERLLPAGESFGRLRAWVEHYTTCEWACDVQLVVKNREVPSTELGKSGRLGWTVWIKTGELGHHASDLIVRL